MNTLSSAGVAFFDVMSNWVPYLVWAGLGRPSWSVGYATHVLASLLFSVQYVSLIEHSVHRWLMHDKTAGNTLHWGRLKETYKEHMIHHYKWYHVFNHEANPIGRLFNLTISLLSDSTLIVISSVIVGLFDPLTGVISATLGVVHFFVFNAIHIEMHVVEEPRYTKTRLFAYWEFYHFLHHLDPGKNFNVVIPMWDWLLGVKMKAKPEHRQALKHAKRFLRLRNELEARNLDGYIVPAQSGRGLWLTGSAVDGCCIVLKDRAAIFVNHEQAEQLKIDTAGGFIVSPHADDPLLRIRASKDPSKDACQWLNDHLAGGEELAHSSSRLQIEQLRLVARAKNAQLTHEEIIDTVIASAGRHAGKHFSSLAAA